MGLESSPWPLLNKESLLPASNSSVPFLSNFTTRPAPASAKNKLSPPSLVSAAGVFTANTFLRLKDGQALPVSSTNDTSPLTAETAISLEPENTDTKSASTDH